MTLAKPNLPGEVWAFEAIALEEMNGVSLMNRFDVKYLIPLAALPSVLNEASAFYRILEINSERVFQYDTLYYDTPKLHLYNFHHAGKKDRYKVRFRNYVESDLSFFEIKHKNNKGKTYKSRISLPTEFSSRLNPAMSSFLTESTPLAADKMEESLRVYYQRMTLVNKVRPERITIDINLKFEHADRAARYPNMVIFEVKQEKMRSSEIIHILRKYHFRPGSISKYCLGVISTHPEVKYNRFKNTYNLINKLNDFRSDFSPGRH